MERAGLIHELSNQIILPVLTINTHHVRRTKSLIQKPNCEVIKHDLSDPWFTFGKSMKYSLRKSHGLILKMSSLQK